MKHLISRQFILLGIIVFCLFFSISRVQAITPTLLVTPTGDGDSVQLNITGDSNTGVLLYYVKNGSGQRISSIGSTNANGNLTITVSSSNYGIISNSLVYVKLGGINGSQSQTISWPSVSSLTSSSNMLSLSQTGLVLTIGQSSTVTANNMGSSSLYLSSNSSPMIANINLSGNQITVLANSYGSTVASICLVNNNTNCSSIYVTVQNSSVQPLTFSQNSVSLSAGQNVSIQITGGSGSYNVLNNASQNQGIIQTSISGSTITLTTSSTTGSSSITVCSSDNSSCGIINVTIGSVNSTAVTFSQSNPTVYIGQNVNVSVYGPTNSLLYVSSNSNPSIVQANLSGTTLTLLGITNGSSVLSVCAATNNCGSLTVTVNYGSGTSTGSGHPILSQENISLSIGQTSTITISGGSLPYTIYSTASNIFQPSLNVNILTLYGTSPGSSAMNVCSAGGNCATLSVTVLSSPTTSSFPVGCLSNAGYSQITGLSCNPAPVISTLPTGCLSNDGYSQTTGISCNTSIINTIPAGCTSTTPFSTVTGQTCPNYISITSTTTSIPRITPATTNTTFKFTKSIKLGSKGTEVLELQKKLKTLGFYKGKVDGGFGSTTEKAVKAFQKAHKLPQLGNVGPKTRDLLNK